MTTELETKTITMTRGEDVAKAAGRKARRRAFRLSFQGFLMDLIKRPAAAPEAPKAPKNDAKPVEAPRTEKPAEARTDAPRPEAPKAEAPAPEARDEAPKADAPNEAADDRPAEARDEAESDEAPKAADGAAETEGDDPGADVRDGLVRVRLVHAEIRIAADRPVEPAEIEAIAGEIRDLLDDPDVTVEDLGAAVAQIAEIFGVEPAEAAQAVEVVADDPPARRALLRRVLERVERALVEKTGDDRPRPAGDEKPAEAPEAPKTAADEALGRVLKKIEAAIKRLEVAPPEPEAKAEAPKAENEAPRADRRLDGEAVRRAQTAQTQAPVEAPRPAAAAIAAVQAAEPGAVGAAAKVSAKNPVIRAVASAEAARAPGEAAKAGARGAGEGHYASAEYRRNESQRAREAPPRPVYRTPVEENVLREVIQRARFVVENGKSEATIELKPEFLGRLKIKVVVEDGKTQVTIRAENAAVRAILEANLDDLRRSLAASGLEADILEVAAGGAGWTPADERGDEAAAGRGHAGGDGTAEDGVGDAGITAAEIESIRNEALRSSVSYVA